MSPGTHPAFWAAVRFVFVLLLWAHRVHVSCIQITNEAPSCNRCGGGSAVGRICARARRPGIWHQLGRRLGGPPTAGLCGGKRPQGLSGPHVGEPQGAAARGRKWSLGDQRRPGPQGAAERAGQAGPPFGCGICAVSGEIELSQQRCAQQAAVRETSSPAQASGYCKAIFATPTAINATTRPAQSPAAIKTTIIAIANKAKAIDGTGAAN